MKNRNSKICLDFITRAFMILSLGFILNNCKKEEQKPHPSISALNPPFGFVGAQVTIVGDNFSANKSEVKVQFNSTEALVVTSSRNEVVVAVPSGATTGKVSVSQNGFTAVSEQDFRVLVPATIAQFIPASGPVGTTVTISGTNFDLSPAMNSVSFNGTAATVTASTATTLITTVPAGATTGTISVTVNGRTITSPSFFIVMPPPTITTFSPVTAAAGATVTIIGTNFDLTPGNNIVKFNGTPASVTSANATTLTVTVPTGSTTGTITVTSHGMTATSPSSFIVIPPPTITNFSPASGGPGAVVTITGFGFFATPIFNHVKFNGLMAKVIGGTSTSLDVVVPTGGTNGPITVTALETATAATNFIFTNSVSPSMPGSAYLLGTVGLEVSDNLTGEYNIGYEFIPKANSTIVALGLSTPVSGTYTVQLYDKASQALLGSSIVNYTGNPANPYRFSYANLPNAVNVIPSKAYYVVYTVNSASDNYYRVENPVLPIDSQYLTITSGVYGPKLSCPGPTNRVSVIYFADVQFQ